jgi:chorismate synthase
MLAAASATAGGAPAAARAGAGAPAPPSSSSARLLARGGFTSNPTTTSRQQRLTTTLRPNSAGSTYGTNFRVTTFGESHGKGVGCVVDGVPPRLPISTEEIQRELDRRRPGQSIITTPRKEEDTCEVLSGVADGVTLGTPIAVLVRNKDQRSQDYSEMSVAYRPSHADATYDFKYGIRAVAGGGRSSARETIGRVAAGAIAKKLLEVVAGTEVLAYVSRVRDIGCEVDDSTFTMEDVERNIARCPDQQAAEKMIDGEFYWGLVGVGLGGARLEKTKKTTPASGKRASGAGRSVLPCSSLSLSRSHSTQNSPSSHPLTPQKKSHQRGAHARRVVRRGGHVRRALLPERAWIPRLWQARGRARQGPHEPARY